MPAPLPLLSWIIDASLKGSVVIGLVALIVLVAGSRLGAPQPPSPELTCPRPPLPLQSRTRRPPGRR